MSKLLAKNWIYISAHHLKNVLLYTEAYLSGSFWRYGH